MVFLDFGSFMIYLYFVNNTFNCVNKILYFILHELNQYNIPSVIWIVGTHVFHILPPTHPRPNSMKCCQYERLMI